MQRREALVAESDGQDFPERSGGDEAFERLVLVNRLLRDVSSEMDEKEAARGNDRRREEERSSAVRGFQRVPPARCP